MIDIIIPIWNQAQLTVRCLQTIRQHTLTYKLILVDNGSQPEEWKTIADELKNHEQAEVITNPSNRGFVKAVNQGIKASTAEYVVLMNNDTEAVPGWIPKLMEPLQASEKIVMSGPLTTTTESWQGKYPKGKKGWILRESGMLAFFCTMFKRTLFDEIGLLDERFGIGFGDDDDFCYRTLKAGYKMALVQDLVIPHHHRSSFRKAFSEYEIKEMQRNAMQVYRDKHKIQNPVDVVYVLGNGSKWDNNELRISIRSFEKYFENLRNIVVVGEHVEWLKNAIHIPLPEPKEGNKDARMAIKLLAACKDPRVSENFIFCYDDTALLKPLKAEDFKGWHEGPIMYDASVDIADHRSASPNASQHSSEWFDYVYATGRELQKRSLPDNNYDKAHCPQPINKTEFLKVMQQWNMWDNQFTVCNVYCNSSQIFKGENIRGRNLKIYGELTTEEITLMATGKDCINYNDRGLCDNFKSWLYAKFPEGSMFEVFSTGDTKRQAVEQWIKSGYNYEEGIEIFRRFAPRNQRLLKYFEMKRNNEISDKKLKYTLQLWLH
jgi:GT2 family glycosyltransferase